GITTPAGALSGRRIPLVLPRKSIQRTLLAYRESPSIVSPLGGGQAIENVASPSRVTRPPFLEKTCPHPFPIASPFPSAMRSRSAPPPTAGVPGARCLTGAALGLSNSFRPSRRPEAFFFALSAASR